MKLTALKGLLVHAIWKSAIFQKILRGGAWMAVSTFVAQAAGMVNSILLARILGVEDFGRFGVLNSTVLVFAALATRSMYVTATKFLSQFKKTDPIRAGRLCGLCWATTAGVGAFMGLLVFLLAGPISLWVAEPALKSLLQVSALTIFGSAVVGVQSGMILAFQRIRFLAITSALFGLAKPALLPFLALSFGLVGIIWGIVLITALNWMVNSQLLRKAFAGSGVKFTFQGMGLEKAILWKFTLPHTLSALLNTPVIWLTILLLAKSPNGIAEVAIFSAVERWRKLILFLPGTISKPSIPILAEAFGLENYKRAGKVIFGTLGINAAICGAIALVLALFAPQLLGLFGPEFRAGGVPTMWVLVAAAFVQALNVPLGDSLVTAGRTWLGLVGTISRGVLLLGVTFLLLDLGSLGLAWAHFSAAIVLFLFQVGLTWWILSGKRAV